LKESHFITPLAIAQAISLKVAKASRERLHPSVALSFVGKQEAEGKIAIAIERN